MLRFAEELILLLLDKETGVPVPVPDRSMRCALAGAVLMDLALENRIDTDLESLFLVDATPVGDALLDPSLAMIAKSDETRDAAYWIERLAEPAIAGEVRRTARARLVRRGILEREAGSGLLTFARRVVRSRRYPAVDGAAGQEVELRIMSVLFSEEIPEPRDIMLICLVDACGIFDRLLSPREQAETRERIDLIGQLELIGRTVFAAIRKAGTPGAEVPRTRGRSAADPPRADGGGLPILGNALRMRGDIVPWLARQYRELGPVFRVRALSRKYTVLAGPEANVFLQRQGRVHLRNCDAYAGLAAGLDGHRLVLSMDGREHFRLRRILKDGYSRAFLNARLDEAVALAVRAIDQVPEGEPTPTLRLMQQIVSDQLGTLLTGVSPDGYLEDLVFYLDRILAASVTNRLPGLMMRTPRMRRVTARVHQLHERVMDAHKPEGREGKEPDLIDDVLALHRSDPQFLPESDLKTACLGPFIAGVHTAASVNAFMLYALFKHPEVMTGVRAEARELFAGEGPTVSKLRAMDTTHRAAMETMRVYHTSPAQLRTVVNGFGFGGYWIAPGTRVLFAIAVPHVCADHYPEPHRFDIDRYLPERAEHRKPGVYAPFGLGTHRCLGSGFAEGLLALTIAAILQHAEIAMHPPEYGLETDYSVLAAPKPSFKITVAPRH